jgi:hypothetical protein
MRAKRVDANHQQTVKAFRKFGFTVADTAALGNGFPDCVISRQMKTAVIEIKDGEKPPSARELTPAEKKFRAGWNGIYFIVESLKDVERIANDWGKM